MMSPVIYFFFPASTSGSANVLSRCRRYELRGSPSGIQCTKTMSGVAITMHLKEIALGCKGEFVEELGRICDDARG
jgi:hypothetical protein